MTLAAVIFDVDGTLLAPEGAGASALHMEGLRRAYDVLAAGGVELPDFRTTFDLVFRELSRSAVALAFGNFRENDLPALVRGFLARAFPDTPDAVVAEALDAWHEPFAERVEALPGALDALREAGAMGLKRAAAGNSPWGGAFLARALARAGLRDDVEAVRTSADVGYRKPNLFLLQETLNALGTEAARTVHVGDDPREDVEAPQELGMRAILLAPPGSNARADRTVAALSDLPGVLREWNR